MSSEDFCAFHGNDFLSLAKKKCTPLPDTLRLDYRVVAEFQHKERVVYSFGLPGRNYGMEICGKQFEADRAFYAFVERFIPTTEIAEFRNTLSRMNAIFGDHK